MPGKETEASLINEEGNEIKDDSTRYKLPF